MHEYGLVEAVVGHALEACRGQRDFQAVCVRIRVGEFAFAARESLATAFQILSRGTPLEGARLDIQEVPGSARCESGGFEGSAADLGPEVSDPPALFLCPGCGSPLLITAGAGVTLTEVQLQDRRGSRNPSSEGGGR